MVYVQGAGTATPWLGERKMLTVSLLHFFILILKEELIFPKGWFQLMQPGGGFAVLGKERALYPVRVAGLDEPEHEHFLAVDLGDALYLNLAGASAH